MEGPLRQVERIDDWKKLYLYVSAESGRDQGGVGDGGALDGMGLVRMKAHLLGIGLRKQLAQRWQLFDGSQKMDLLLGRL